MFSNKYLLYQYFIISAEEVELSMVHVEFLVHGFNSSIEEWRGVETKINEMTQKVRINDSPQSSPVFGIEIVTIRRGRIIRSTKSGTTGISTNFNKYIFSCALMRMTF